MASLFISDDFHTLETYFFGDAIGEANDLIADKVELAWDMISSSTLPYQATVNSDGTQLTREYAVESFSEWQGSAMIVVNGSGLSTDEAWLANPEHCTASCPSEQLALSAKFRTYLAFFLACLPRYMVSNTP